LTHFARPFDTFPYTEIAHDPDKKQCASQFPADAAHMFHSFRDLQCSASAHTVIMFTIVVLNKAELFVSKSPNLKLKIDINEQLKPSATVCGLSV
jgi:hypothetical protein